MGERALPRIMTQHLKIYWVCLRSWLPCFGIVVHIDLVFRIRFRGVTAVPQEDVFLDMGVLIKRVLKGLLWVLPMAALVAFATFYLASQKPAEYTSESKVLIDTANIVLPGQLRNGEQERSLLDKEGIASQVQLLQSRDLVRHVVKDLKLERNPAFADNGKGGLVKQLMRLAGIELPAEQRSAEERVLKALTKNLDVFQIDGSRVIAVQFTSKDPEVAAQVVNTLVAAYQQLQENAKRSITNSTAQALEPQVERLQKEVEEARQKVEDFRAQADLLLSTENRTLNQQQLTELNSQVSAAIVARSEAEAQAKLIRSLLDNGGSLETATQVLSSGLIQRLRERQIALENRIAELSTTLLPNHPTIKSLRSQLRGYDRQIREEARKIMVGLENDATLAQERYENLSKRVSELKRQAARSGTDQVRLQELQQAAQSKAEQLNQVLISLREAEILQGAGILNANSRVIARAAVPSEPSGRKPAALAGMAGFAALFLGCLWSVVRALVSGEALRREAYGSPVVPQNNPRAQTGTAASNALENVVAATAQSHRPEPVVPDLKPSLDEDEPVAATLNDEVVEKAPPVDETDAELSELEAAPAFSEPVVETQVEVVDNISDGPDAVVDETEASEDEADDETDTSEDHQDETPVTEVIAPAQPLERVRRVVVLSVDDQTLSSRVALSCTRKIAAKGIMPVVVEVRSDGGEASQSVLEQAALEEVGDVPAVSGGLYSKPGFAELLEGEAAFTNVIHRDPVSRAHVIQSGHMPIRDEVVYGGRYNLIMEALDLTYDVIVADLGLIEPSLICAQLLSEADRVIIATDGSPAGPELEKALSILEKRTKAPVEVERIESNEAAAWHQLDMAA